MPDDPCSPAPHAAGHHAHHHLAHHVGRHIRLRSIRAPAAHQEAFSCGKHFDASQPGGLAASPLGRAGTSAATHKAALLAGAGGAAIASALSLGLLANASGFLGGAGPTAGGPPAGGVTGQGASSAAGTGASSGPIGPAGLPATMPPPDRGPAALGGQAAPTIVAVPTPVPEPASAALVAFAALVAVLLRYHRRYRAAQDRG